MSETDTITFADALAQAETQLQNAKDAARRRLAELDVERASIKMLLGRKPRAPKSAGPKKERKPRGPNKVKALGVEASEQA